jgi:hypothetical protein
VLIWQLKVIVFIANPSGVNVILAEKTPVARGLFCCGGFNINCLLKKILEIGFEIRKDSHYKY